MEDNKLFFAEPSSVLASRILRAHDNPSPPPESPISEILERKNSAIRQQEGILVDVSDPTTGNADESHDRLSPFIAPVVALANMLSSPFAPIFTPPRTPSRAQDSEALERNLIDFDSSATLPRMSASPAHPPPIDPNDPQNAQEQAGMVDLLTFSPESPTPKSFVPSTQPQTSSISTGSSGSSADEETQVLRVLTDGKSGQRTLPQRDVVVDTEARLRRSTRPRRTPSPIRPLTVESSAMGTDSQDSIETPLKSRRKSPRRSRSPTKGMTQQTEKRDDLLSESKAFQVSRDASEEPSPSRSSPRKRSLSPSVARAQSVDHPHTKSESNNSEHPSVSASTPARRVPISVAIRDGTISPQKASSLVFANRMKGKSAASGSRIGILGSPVFKRPALDDPIRSPAKRVPLSETTALPRTSPLKEKGPIRHGRYLRAMSEDQDNLPPRTRLRAPSRRSMSEEPTAASSVIPPARLLRSAPQHSPTVSANVSDMPEIRQNQPVTTLPYPIVATPTRLPQSIPEVDEGGPKPRSGLREPAQHSSPGKSGPKSKSSLRVPSSSVTSRIPRVEAKPYSRPKPSTTAQASKLPSSTIASKANVGQFIVHLVTLFNSSFLNNIKGSTTTACEGHTKQRQ